VKRPKQSIKHIAIILTKLKKESIIIRSMSSFSREGKKFLWRKKLPFCCSQEGRAPGSKIEMARSYRSNFIRD
jgi:hypothetical protein